MKNFIFIILLLLSPAILLSQKNTSLDIVGSYDFINSVSFNGSFINIDKKRKDNIKRRSSYRFGININFKAFDKIWLKTGFRFVKFGYLADSYIGDEISFEPFTYDHYYVYYDESYIEVPVVLRYEFAKHKCSFFMEFGILPHLKLKGWKTVDHEYLIYSEENQDWGSTEDETIYDSSMKFEIPYLKDSRIRLAYTFGLGMNYDLSQKNQLFIQPTLRIYPKVENSNISPFTLATTNIINVGFEFGARRYIGL